jgi:tetratricopeptide (TPR) repeat protein
MSLNNLADLLRGQGDLAAARPLFERALAIFEKALGPDEKVLGPNHRWTKDTARVTAEALDALARDDQAAALRARYGVEQDRENEARPSIAECDALDP